jgi:adenine-specific DNA-methyltransferase
MIYPRLKIAKDFLSEDGVIFISINDYELDNLHKICDEIFGRVHYLGTIVWKARVKPVNIGEVKFKPQKEIEYILCYEKTVNSLFYPILIGSKRSYPFDLNGRKYRLATILKSNRGGSFRTTMSFELNGFKPKEGQRWQAGKNEIERLWKEGYIEFKQGTPFRRYFEDEESAEHSPFYCFMDKEWSSTSEAGKAELNALLGEFHGFDTVKPITLLRTLLISSTHDGDLVMDFFSGSSTIAHAVLQLNSEYNENRKFLNIQVPEVCSDSKIDGEKVNNICQIGEERIRRAGKKIKEETGADIDYGFRCFKVDSSNMKDVYYKPSDLKQEEISLFEDNIKEDRTPEDLLIQVMLDLGVLLSSKVEQTEFAGKKVFSVADGYLMACFDEQVTEEVVTAIAKKKPFYAVFRDSSMANDSVAANFEQIFATYSPQTVRRVL